MPKYVKDGHVIFASNKAYDLIYEKMGYAPYVEEKITEEPQVQEAPKEEELDDFADDPEEESVVEIDSNEAMPLYARVSMLSYADLKAKAKELSIPKYSSVKREDLVNLVVEAIEAKNA